MSENHTDRPCTCGLSRWSDTGVCEACGGTDAGALLLPKGDLRMSIDGVRTDPTYWRLTLVNDSAPFPEGLQLATSFEAPQLSATFEVDAKTFEALAGKPEQTFTVKQTIDLNPWHRKVTGVRARLRRARSIIRWEFERRVLRRSVAGTVEITVPNCRMVSE